MYIEIKEQKSKKKYYLAHSYRKGNKIKKIRHYLGENLSEEELKTKAKQAEEIIKEKIKLLDKINDPLLTVLSDKEIKEIEALESKANLKIIHLNEDDWRRFTEEFVYDTNAIEGSTVTEKEVKEILEDNKWPDRSKWEISETYGLADAVKFIRETKEHLSLDLMRKLHELVFKNSKPYAGRFREKGTEVAVFNEKGDIVHRGAPSTEVIGLLKELIDWYSQNKNRYSPLILASVVHNQFESIHPFQDGNGRVGRLLLNNILLRNNYPPVNIELENRSDYYKTLQEYQKNHNLRPTIEFLLKEYRKMKY